MCFSFVVSEESAHACAKETKEKETKTVSQQRTIRAERAH